MSIIGKKFLNLFNKPAKRKVKGKAAKPFDEAAHIGIFYTWEDKAKEEAVEKMANFFRQTKQTDLLCFNPSKEPVETEHETVSYNELSSLGKFNSDALNAFLKKPFDYFFVFDFDLNEVSRYTLIHTAANFRVGVHSEADMEYFELMIGIHKSAGFHNLAEQTVKYIKEIR